MGHGHGAVGAALQASRLVKTIVVTGSTRGIGLGLAENFLKRDCRVVVSGRKQTDVDRVVSQLGARFGAERVAGQACDITDAESVQTLWGAAVQRFGSVEVWINNAGMNINQAPLWEQSAAALKQLVDTNLTGLLFACKVALAGMKEQGRGQLWNLEGFGSNGMTRAGLTAYGATKRAVDYLNRALRKDAAGTGVQVCALSPGMVLTDLLIGEYDFDSAAGQRAKGLFNILADRVETVTPWLAEQVLKTDRDGARVAWLTTGKVMARFLTARLRKRDLFADPAPDRAANGR